MAATATPVTAQPNDDDNMGYPHAQHVGPNVLPPSTLSFILLYLILFDNNDRSSSFTQ